MLRAPALTLLQGRRRTVAAGATGAACACADPLSWPREASTRCASTGRAACTAGATAPSGSSAMWTSMPNSSAPMPMDARTVRCAPARVASQHWNYCRARPWPRAMRIQSRFPSVAQCMCGDQTSMGNVGWVCPRAWDWARRASPPRPAQPCGAPSCSCKAAPRASIAAPATRWCSRITATSSDAATTATARSAVPPLAALRAPYGIHAASPATACRRRARCGRSCAEADTARCSWM
mmetsp:Transcript_11583/g.48664  ORF Transcript_11583/g.48664 Transcript_11583/m.48664 type:complete len:237 (-) Transcript_11583:984-1694(-)